MTKNFDCLHCFVKGRVQGVGFRNWVLKQSTKYKFNGWVKNCDNGEVEIKVTGNINKLRVFLVALQKGPLLAKVEGINYDISKSSLLNSFRVLR